MAIASYSQIKNVPQLLTLEHRVNTCIMTPQGAVCRAKPKGSNCLLFSKQLLPFVFAEQQRAPHSEAADRYGNIRARELLLLDSNGNKNSILYILPLIGGH